jgi:hypothetical protein
MISIDLGLNGCGVAWWASGLFHAYYLKRISGGSASKAYQMAWTLYQKYRDPMPPLTKDGQIIIDTRVIIERPRIYTKMKGDPADILNLLEVGATFQGMLGRPVEWVEPHAWKGNIDPDAMTERIHGRLLPAELKRIDPCPKSLEHNILDAIGIGLATLGRLERKRVIAR